MQRYISLYISFFLSFDLSLSLSLHFFFARMYMYNVANRTGRASTIIPLQYCYRLFSRKFFSKTRTFELLRKIMVAKMRRNVP